MIWVRGMAGVALVFLAIATASQAEDSMPWPAELTDENVWSQLRDHLCDGTASSRCTQEAEPGMAASYLAIASCVALLVIGLLVFLICWVWRGGAGCGCGCGCCCCCRKEPRSATEQKEMHIEGAGTEARSGDYEQAMPCPAEYSYAYGHVRQSPATDPGMVAHGPDLDEQQADHYYSRLGRGGDGGSGGGAGGGPPNTGPETGPTPEPPEATDPPPAHAATPGDREPGGGAAARSSGYEVARAPGLTPRGSGTGGTDPVAPPGADSGYEVATAKPAGDAGVSQTYFTLESGGADTGYEVATAKPAEDAGVSQTYFTLESGGADTGYEVATAKPAGDAGVSQTYFTLESGYEEVTKTDDTEADDECKSPGYDRLKRPATLFSTP